MIRSQVKNNVAIQILVSELMLYCQQNFSSLTKAEQDAVEAILERPASDFWRAIPHIKNVFSELSPIAIEHALRIADAQNSAEDECDYFIRNGANLEMVVALFKIRPSEYRRRRAALNVTTNGGGRPKLPNEAQRDVIYGDWLALREEGSKTLREKLKSLHEIHSSWSLVSIVGALQECDALPQWPGVAHEPEKRSAHIENSLAISRQVRAARTALRNEAPR